MSNVPMEMERETAEAFAAETTSRSGRMMIECSREIERIVDNR